MMMNKRAREEGRSKSQKDRDVVKPLWICASLRKLWRRFYWQRKIERLKSYIDGNYIYTSQIERIFLVGEYNMYATIMHPSEKCISEKS